MVAITPDNIQRACSDRSRCPKDYYMTKHGHSPAKILIIAMANFYETMLATIMKIEDEFSGEML
jgi:hypothetical protein